MLTNERITDGPMRVMDPYSYGIASGWDGGVCGLAFGRDEAKLSGACK